MNELPPGYHAARTGWQISTPGGVTPVQINQTLKPQGHTENLSASIPRFHRHRDNAPSQLTHTFGR